MNTKIKLEKFYEDIYKDIILDNISITNINNRPKNRQEAAALIASRGSGRFLEIGSGFGEVAMSIKDKYSKLVLIEISPSLVKKLKYLFSNIKNIEIFHHNIDEETLNYPDNYFDTALMSAVIEHLVDPINALRQIHRVLSPGGKLILDTPNIAKWTRRLKLLLGFFPSTASLREGLLCYDKKTPTKLYDEGHLHYFTYRSLSRICTEFIGFKKVEWFGFGSWEYSRTPFYFAKFFPQMFSDVCLVAYK